MLSLNVNGRDHQVDVEPEMPLLWVLREQLGMTGTKFGCGIAQCGACTVHLDGQPVRSCSYPASAAQDRKVVTIEGCRPPPRIRCKWLGRPWTCRSAVIANPARFWRQRPCCKTNPNRPMPTSMRP